MTNTNSGGTWTGYSGNLGYVTQLGAGGMELLAPKKGEKILDVGCGAGDHILEMLAVGAHAFGVDPSPEQIAACRAKGLGADIVGQYSAENLPHDIYNGFDAVFSNAALHYMTDPEAGFANIAAALKTGGRLVAEMGGTISDGPIDDSNLVVMQKSIADIFWLMQTQSSGSDLVGSIVDPIKVPTLVGRNFVGATPYIYHPKVSTLAHTLDEVGLTLEMAMIFRRPTPIAISQLPTAVRMYSTNLLQHIPSSHVDAYVQRVADLLVAQLPEAPPSKELPQGGVVMDYIRLRFAAVKTV